jgi:osmotically inducible protein OsmC
MATRTAQAQWLGTLREGEGSLSFGGFSGPYSFASRFETGPGTNPEELIGAAHAGCFSMALAGMLTQAGHPPQRIRTTARVHINLVDGHHTINRIELDTEGQVPGLDEPAFQEFAEQAKRSCPVSRALAGVPEITLQARLAGPVTA